MAKFEIHPISRFASTSTAIKRPREIAYFSYDSDHKFRLDESSLSYYYPPALPADLSAGFDTFDDLKEEQKGDEHIDSLLKTILELEKKEGKKREVDFVTWRGMMTKIMAVPFDKFNEFEMNATCFQGTIFIEEDNQSKIESREQQLKQPQRSGGPSQQLMTYWGYKFETLSLLPAPWGDVSRDDIENRGKQVVSNKAQYCSVVQTGIGGSTLILGGEVDALWDCKPEDPETPINWVELKTSEDPRSDHDMLKFERKLLKFWIQSFLLGVPKIIVGFRDKNGILRRLEELETQKLPGQVKRVGKGSWDGNLCISFTAKFLEFLKQTITTEGTWRIRHRRNSPAIEVERLTDQGHGQILTTEFVEWRSTLIATEASRMLGMIDR